MLKGKYINLRKVEEEDLPVFKQWMTSQDFSTALRGSILSREAEGRINSMIEENMKTYGSLQYFAIEDKNHKLIGLLMFVFINWKDRNLAIEVYLGERSLRGGLYGAEAIILSSIYAFHHLNMHRISMYINEFNRNILGIAYKTSKFEGKLKKQVFHGGKFWDVYVFGVLRDEFEKNLGYTDKLGLKYVKTKKYYL